MELTANHVVFFSFQVTEEDIALCMGEMESPLADVENVKEHPLRILSQENLTVVSTFTGELYFSFPNQKIYLQKGKREASVFPLLAFLPFSLNCISFFFLHSFRFLCKYGKWGDCIYSKTSKYLLYTVVLSLHAIYLDKNPTLKSD